MSWRPWVTRTPQTTRAASRTGSRPASPSKGVAEENGIPIGESEASHGRHAGLGGGAGAVRAAGVESRGAGHPALPVREPDLRFGGAAIVLRGDRDVRRHPVHPALRARRPRAVGDELGDRPHADRLRDDGPVEILGGQTFARVRRVKPFSLFGTIATTFGVCLLTKLDTGSSTANVALFPTVTGLGSELIVPTAPLAVQSKVDRRLLGVATSATQFIRSIGLTIGTALVGSLVTSDYARDLRTDAPPRAPERLILRAREPAGARERRDPRRPLPRSLGVSRRRAGLERRAHGGLSAARAALSGAIHAGFVLILSTAAAIVTALLMKNLKPENPAAVAAPEEAPTGDPALNATLATAVGRARPAGPHPRPLPQVRRDLAGRPSEARRGRRAPECGRPHPIRQRGLPGPRPGRRGALGWPTRRARAGSRRLQDGDRSARRPWYGRRQVAWRPTRTPSSLGPSPSKA